MEVGSACFAQDIPALLHKEGKLILSANRRGRPAGRRGNRNQRFRTFACSAMNIALLSSVGSRIVGRLILSPITAAKFKSSLVSLVRSTKAPVRCRDMASGV